MKISVLVLVVLLCFPIIVSAVPDSAVVGPYKISFDLGLSKGDYATNVTGPKQSETFSGNPITGYFVNMANENYTSTISIIHYGAPMYTKNESDLISTKNVLRLLCNDGNVRTYNRVIDNQDGLLSVSLDCQNHGNMFFGDYWINEIDNFSNTNCRIFSTYPWDEGTLSLLKTIHVEKVT